MEWECESERVGGCSIGCGGSTCDAPILNQLTWTELARRYSLLFMSSHGVSGSSNDSGGIDVFRCVHGDGGIVCGALTGVAGLKVDMWLLMTAENKIYGDLVNERIPDWIHELKPVEKLNTNVGAKIRNCINLSLDNCPPEWAAKELEHSISKDVFKGNASSQTKHAALDVVKRFMSLQQNISFSNKSIDIYTYDIVLRQCRILLRQLAAEFSEMNKKKTTHGNSLVLMRAYLRTIDVKLATGVYRGSHRAFAEDVRELCRKYALSKLLMEFEDLYKNKIVPLHRELLGCSNLESLRPDLREDDEDALPKATWDDRVCKICVIDENDDKVLLCDQCDKEIHTYCLTPPLPRVPSGEWFCPSCVSGKKITEDTYQVDNKTPKYIDLLLKEAAHLETMMNEKDYWDLAMNERTRLLRFFCDEVLNSKLLKQHIKKSKLKDPPEFSVACKFLGLDSDKRLDWILDSGAGPWVLVSDKTEHNVGSLYKHDLSKLCTSAPSWTCYRSEMEIRNLMDYLEKDTLMNGKLNQAIREQHNSKNVHSLPVNQGQDLFCVNKAMTKATRLLQGKYGAFIELNTTRGRKVYRCECLEPIFPTRLHCFICHKSCDTKKELKSHGDGKCNGILQQNSSMKTCQELPKGNNEKSWSQDSSISLSPMVGGYVEPSDTMQVDIPEGTDKEGNILLSHEVEMELVISKFLKENVPVSSLTPLDGKSSTVLKQLKISLLDMEAALPEDSSKADLERKQAWRAFVKDTSTIYEMVQAMIVFEDTIKADYLDEFWKQNFSSASAAANISTLAALYFRLLSLDASICYQKIPCHPNKPKIKETKKVNGTHNTKRNQ